MEAINNIIIRIWNEYECMYEYRCKSTITIGITTKCDEKGDGDGDAADDDEEDYALFSNDPCSSKDIGLCKFPLYIPSGGVVSPIFGGSKCQIASSSSHGESI
jgi:hypothetical protein